ncbi:tRNA uridine-5-carboxymethylaminomethyl(34) synthesis GTPase MnmE [Lichenicoccus roseus]|uniref:tRNA modification GTPase MnmE n=1 Tax=Lichenicoccus roseus TaxID=2683649 RepID=A0A5R9J7E6_9PROT|nr:tRNA uridine-5-carboxymethylaminomethyl(34) synthesis GTPase MnmE [Lichenicoccus roseus]TLU71541.1 tRNA uridine-5-carboxymethylaminomethyl(34) synthesis GTPase MnmE [Lichenicoccus roseus]
MTHQRTVFALSTGSGRAAIAIMRLTGPDCGRLLDVLCRGRRPAPRQASLRNLGAGELLDRSLVLWFPAPNSYTGEDCAELHLHAGPAVVEAVADSLIGLGASPAEPGEFTRRAFANGRLDLLEAEGIADLVEAETQAQRRQALRQSGGALSELYDGWARRLRQLLAQQEALIDFPDEDLPQEVEEALINGVVGLRIEMQTHLASGDAGERLRSGLVFAIVGAPNVGKSSLLNLLARREAAIVSAIAGTTRDALEVRVVLGSVPVTLVDTAGLRETIDPVEAEGVRRARHHAGRADVVVHVVEAGTAEPVLPATGEARVITVYNKTDRYPAPEGRIGVSATTGDGMEALQNTLVAAAAELTSLTAGVPLTRARHRAGITEAVAHLEGAGSAIWPELRGEELRLAMRALGRLTGAVHVEDLLDSIFGQFCIGK